MAKKVKKVAKRAKPRTGPGRPPKPRQPPPELEQEITGAEADRLAATQAHRAEPSVENKATVLETEMRCCQAHAALCRFEGNYTHALKYGELLAKLAAQHATTLDQRAYDQVKRLEQQKRRERAAASRTGGR